jgi:hypothetical protein
VFLVLFISLLISGCSSESDVSAIPLPTSTNPQSEHWMPSPGSSFQIQFSGEIDLNTDGQVIDLDAFETDAAMIEQLHQAGKKVICYINAGSAEDWRSDMEQFPAEVISKAYDGWPGENWLDIRNLDALAPIIIARLEMCKSKGFDGVEFDNMDGYQNDTGFDLTAEDQLAYNRWLADQAHLLGLAVGLKNDPEQIIELEPWFDFVILESCFKQGWCELAKAFVEAEKPVFDIEYSESVFNCDEASELSIVLIRKNRELDEFIEVCP